MAQLETHVDRTGIQALIMRTVNFVNRCRHSQSDYAFSSFQGGPETLYASCFAAMILHYVGHLDRLSPNERRRWAAYLNAWQDPDTGYFYGPEIEPDQITSRKHSLEHISQHLAAHVLPALNLLGSKPRYPLAFAQTFTDKDNLQEWLDARDWHDAWLEGNNLLFIGQFLIHLRDVEQNRRAQRALDHLFAWLDAEVDPDTGLWGSNGYCSNAAALYGGYHQLLLYYYEGRRVNFPRRLVDVALSLQHLDGGFNLRGGGGACEDVDAIDILVNMYKRFDYRRTEIRIALRKALSHILQRQMPDGGFVYRLDEPFIHMGIEKTATPANQSNLFPTWFRLHTLALISQILTDEPSAGFDWKFNQDCSMGWHQTWEKQQHALSMADVLAERQFYMLRKFKRVAAKPYRFTRRSMRFVKRKLARN